MTQKKSKRKTSAKLRYSVVIPAHNEEGNLEPLLNRLHEVLSRTKSPFEIIIVNDNSKDNSYALLKRLKMVYSELVLINRTSDPGVGNAIRAGLKSAKGQIIITLDGDLSHDPQEIPKLLKMLGTYDMVCGSRYIQGGSADMQASRKMVSGLFNLIFRFLIGIPVRDFTSGFRVYKRQIIDTINLRNPKFGIYIEIPFKAHLAGFKLTEIPITYHKRGKGASNLNYFIQGPEYLRVAGEALKIKFLRPIKNSPSSSKKT